jgi:hypothetical protein
MENNQLGIPPQSHSEIYHCNCHHFEFLIIIFNKISTPMQMEIVRENKVNRKKEKIGYQNIRLYS